MRIGPCAAAGGSRHIYYFTRPDVLDLSDSARLDQRTLRAPVALGQLSAEIAQIIHTADTRSPDSPEMMLWLDDGEAGSRPTLAHEKQRLSKAAPMVRREGRQLIVTTERGGEISFRDGLAASSAVADGDSETFVYAGRMDGSGYLRVEVRYRHDAPRSMLINPFSGKTAFAENGNDLVALAPGGKRVLDLAQESPVRLAIASLDADGPAIELLCASAQDATAGRSLSVLFKGWHGADSLDLELSFVPMRDAPAEAVPLGIEFNGREWNISAAAPERLEQTADFSCRQMVSAGR